jgi:hypothetical protein
VFVSKDGSTIRESYSFAETLCWKNMCALVWVFMLSSSLSFHRKSTFCLGKKLIRKSKQRRIHGGVGASHLVGVYHVIFAIEKLLAVCSNSTYFLLLTSESIIMIDQFGMVNYFDNKVQMNANHPE